MRYEELTFGMFYHYFTALDITCISPLDMQSILEQCLYLFHILEQLLGSLEVTRDFLIGNNHLGTCIVLKLRLFVDTIMGTSLVFRRTFTAGVVKFALLKKSQK